MPSNKQTPWVENVQTFKTSGAFQLYITEKVKLKILDRNDVSEAYVSWLNDYEVVKYTEQRYAKHDFRLVKNFVIEKLKSNNEFLFGIFFCDSHIGNVKLGPINMHHGTSQISYLIGERGLWGRGFSTVAISRVLSFAFNDLGLQKMVAAFYEVNYPSQRVLEKCGFEQEGLHHSNVLFEGSRINSVWVGLSAENFFKKNQKR